LSRADPPAARIDQPHAAIHDRRRAPRRGQGRGHAREIRQQKIVVVQISERIPLARRREAGVDRRIHAAARFGHDFRARKSSRQFADRRGRRNEHMPPHRRLRRHAGHRLSEPRRFTKRRGDDEEAGHVEITRATADSTAALAIRVRQYGSGCTQRHPQPKQSISCVTQTCRADRRQGPNWP
jgi:hypothetical protein